MLPENMLIDIEQHIEVSAPVADVFKGLLRRLGEAFEQPDGQSLNMLLEPWPGGRWFRDRGNGIGHLWGHLQVIKPPTLLELSGPMFMSYPAVNHLEIRLEPTAAGAIVRLRHRALGLLEPAHREGVTTGWNHLLTSLQGDFVSTL